MKNKCSIKIQIALYLLIMIFANLFMLSCSTSAKKELAQREKISLNENWTFYRYDMSEEADDLNNEIRPVIESLHDPLAWADGSGRQNAYGRLLV